MSLQIWLPLNGDLTQQGLSNVIASGTLTYSDSGKIGKCANVDSGHVLTIPYSSGAAYDFSFSFWIKIPTAMNSNTDWETMLDFRAMNTVNSTNITTIAMGFAPYHQVKIYSDSNHQHSWRIPTYDVWEHWSIVHHSTASSSNIKLYINGVLDGSYDTSHPLILQNGNIYIGNGVLVGSFALNDFRVYDHALSAKEVKDLAKGLVLHYRLAGPGQENLITTMEAGGRTTLVDKYTLDADFGQNADTYGRINVNPALELDKIYTLSFDVLNMPVGSRWGFQLWNNNNYHFWIEGNGHYSYTFCPSASKLPNGYNLNKFLFDDSTRTNPAGIVTFTNFKIEEGSVATPWCPNPADTLYSAMGYNNNVEYDCSGYRRNGTKSGTITWDIDSPRYTTSYSALSDYPIKAEVNMPSCDSMTVSFWTKITTFGTAKSGLFATSNMSTDPTDYNDTAMAQRDSDIDLKGVSGSGKIFNFTVPSTGQWHHCVFVYDGSKVYYYQDGKKINEEACAIGALKSYQYFYLGYSKAGGVVRKTLGKWSDLRIYTTALSADDIAELYHSAVIVDNTGKSYAYEYFEAQ